MDILHLAAAEGRMRDLQVLLDLGYLTNAIDGSTRVTPLHYAAGAGRLEAVKLLVQAGADINHKDSMGRTPLMRAVSIPVCNYIVMDEEEEDEDIYELPVFTQPIAPVDYIGTISYLLESGCNVNAKDGDGNTAMFYATVPAAVHILLYKGASTSIVNRKGLTALDAARQTNNFGVYLTLSIIGNK